jgi:hypothetical protein
MTEYKTQTPEAEQNKITPEIIKLKQSGVKAEVYTPEGFDPATDYETVIVWPGLGAGDSDREAGLKLFKELGTKRVVYMNTQVYGGLDKKTETPIKDFAELSRGELLANLYPREGGSGEDSETETPKLVHVGHSMGAPMAYAAAKEGDELVLAQGALFNQFEKIGLSRLARQGATVLKLCTEANQALIRGAEEGVRRGVISNAIGIGKAALSLMLSRKGGALKRVFDELVAGKSDQEVKDKALGRLTIIAGGRDSVGSKKEARRRAERLVDMQQAGVAENSMLIRGIDHLPMSSDSIIEATRMAIKHEKLDLKDDGSGIQTDWFPRE